MPAIGMLCGATLAQPLDLVGKYLAGFILLLMGIYIWSRATFFKKKKQSKERITSAKIILLGFVCSLDNLALGFAFGLYHLPFSIPIAAGIMAAISTIMCIVGLEIGKYIGHIAKKINEQIEGVVFIIIGICFILGLV